MTQPRTYLFAGGGTGGHLFPGVAVAQELIRREPNARVLFVGSERELERTILTRYGLEHRALPVEPLRELTRNPWRFATRNWSAWRMARQLIRDEKPGVVIGLGGYISAPLVWAARWSARRERLPIVLLEQNVIPGRATKRLARSANLVCTSFSQTVQHLPSGTVIEWTGNPVRREIVEFSLDNPLSRTEAAAVLPRELLVLGGSQGADSLNDAVVAALRLVERDRGGWRVVHQTGPRQVEAVRHAYAEMGVEAVVEPFFDDMLLRYRAASLVVSRAGATTLAELACCALPMILLPYPQAIDNHQRLNALAVGLGAAVCVEHQSQPEQTAEALADALRELLNDHHRRFHMRFASHSWSRPNAATVIADRIQQLAVPQHG